MAVDHSDDLAARLVAWHNRNPLARRITRAQVVSIGLVSFPFRAPPGTAAAPVSGDRAAAAAAPAAEKGGSLRELAQARARSGAAPARAAAPPAEFSKTTPRARRRWRPAFTEDLLAPRSPADVARWVLRHGSESRPGPPDAPLRELQANAGGPHGAPEARLWSHTAAIDMGAVRLRVLASPLAPRIVLGQRLLDRKRLGVLALCGLMGIGAVLWGMRPSVSDPGITPAEAPAAPAAPVMPAAPAVLAMPAAPAVPETSAATPERRAAPAAPTASAAPSADQSASAATVPAPAPDMPAVPAPAPAGARAAASEPSSPSAPHPGAAIRPPAPLPERKPQSPLRLVPPLDEAARHAARQAGEAARSERAQRLAARLPPALGATAATAPAAAANTALAAPPPPVIAATGAKPAWAVTTRNLRTRFESEQMLAALRDAAQRGGQAQGLRLEVLPAGDDWRAVGWPFASQAEAEKLRAALAARGLQAQVVIF